MENLTRSMRIVYETRDCNPLLGHDLVVFRKIGPTGLEFREVVPAGSRFKKRFFERGEFTAFAVEHGDEILQLKFSSPGEHVDLSHSYVLHFTLHYSVLNPRRIIEKIESDPLKTLKEETVGILDGIARYMDWPVIVKEAELERRLLEHEVPSEAGIEISNLELLRQIANDLGLAIKRISVKRSLAKERTVAKADYDEQLDHKLTLNRQHRERERRHDAEVGQALTNATIGVFDRIVKDPSSTTEARRIISSLAEVENESEKLIGMKALDSGTAEKPPHTFRTGRSTVDTLMIRVLNLISSLGMDSQAERQLGASMLHLLAELSLCQDAEDQMLEKYAGQLTGPFRELYQKRRLSHEQIELIQQLQKPLLCKRELSQETT